MGDIGAGPGAPGRRVVGTPERCVPYCEIGDVTGGRVYESAPER